MSSDDSVHSDENLNEEGEIHNQMESDEEREEVENGANPDGEINEEENADDVKQDSRKRKVIFNN